MFKNSGYNYFKLLGITGHEYVKMVCSYDPIHICARDSNPTARYMKIQLLKFEGVQYLRT